MIIHSVACAPEFIRGATVMGNPGNKEPGGAVSPEHPCLSAQGSSEALRAEKEAAPYERRKNPVALRT